MASNFRELAKEEGAKLREEFVLGGGNLPRFDPSEKKEEAITEAPTNFRELAAQEGTGIGVVGAAAGGAVEGVLSITDLPQLTTGLGGAAVAAGIEGLGFGDELREVNETLFGPEGLLPNFRLRGGSEDIKDAFGFLGVDLGLPEFETLTREEQISARAGMVIGASVPFAAAPFLAARSASNVPAFLKPIVESAKTAPGKFASLEASGALGAGQGAALSETLFPGDPNAALVAEIAGGFINPAGLLGRAVTRASPSVRGITQSFSRAGREQAAAEVLQARALELGEDPGTIAARLRAEDIIGVPLTAAQKSNSKALFDIEAKISQKNRKFADAASTRVKDAMGFVVKQIDSLIKSGNPEDLRLAAKYRQEMFDGLLADRILIAERESAEAAARIGVGGKGQAVASREAFEANRAALKDARDVESSLWERIPKDRNLSPDNIGQKANALRDDILDEESLPLARTLARITGKQDVIAAFQAKNITYDEAITLLLKGFDEVVGLSNSGELLTVRSRLLTRAREATAKGDFNTARINQELADAVSDDLATLGLPEVDAAREFSGLLNDKFTRSFAGKAMGRERTGAFRIPPELMLETAFGRGGTKAALRFRELQEAGGFTDEAVRGADFQETLFGNAVRNQQEAFLRDIGPGLKTNGVVDPNKLETFLAQNDELLNAFPALRADLQDAQTAQRLLDDVEGANRIASEAVRQKTAFARVINNENPAKAIAGVLRSNNPSRDYGQLARMARASGPGATEGLKVSTIDAVTSGARNADGTTNFKALKEALTAPIFGANRPSILGVMRKNKVMSPAEQTRLLKLVDRAVEIEDGIRAANTTGELLDAPDALTDLVIRMSGVRLASVSPLATQGPGQIVAAGAGSRFARRLFEKVPGTRITDVIAEAAENPPFMAALLEKPSSVKQAEVVTKQINGFLFAAGILHDNN